MIAIEQAGRLRLASPAWLLDPDRELAWAGPLVRDNPLYAWILGKYVTSSATPNGNGHIFGLEDLRAQTGTLVHAPMNLLHRPREIMGTYVGAEIVYPVHGPTRSASVAAGLSAETEPFVESLAAMWRYYFREEYDFIKDCHEQGLLAQSMECIPKTVTCAGDGCGRAFAYAGPVSKTYCEHLQVRGAPRRLDLPLFSAGALVIPPARPAWKGAQVTELTAATRDAMRQAEKDGVAEALYEQIKTEFVGLCPADWERIMATLLSMAPTHERGDTHTRRGAPTPDVGAAGDGGTNTSAMVALYPTPEVAEKMAVSGGLAPDALHVTLAYLGPEAVLLLDREAVEAAIGPLAAMSEPLEGVVAGVGRFTPGYPAGQDPWPLYASIDLPTLPEFRQRLVHALEAAGLPVARNHGFMPHMTLAYVGTGDEADAARILAAGVEPVPLHFGDVVLAWGNERIRFPLSAGAQDDDEGGPSRAIAHIVASGREESRRILHRAGLR